MTIEPSSLPREILLARSLVELADTLVDHFDVADLLTRLVDRCVDVLGVDAAGLMLSAPEGGLRLAASSSEALPVLQLFELQAQEGPGLDCCRTGEPVVNLDLAVVTDRWPTFAPAAVEAGFRSVHALPLRLRGQVIGAVSLVRTDAGPMDGTDVLAGQALADMATIAILQHRAAADIHVVNEQLHVALNSRVLIEQAKGVVAERAGLDMAQAFALLRSHARNHNLRLVDVSQQVVDRTLDTAALDRPRRSPDPRT